MSITPNENEKFEAIIAGFEITDTSAVKQMERNSKSSEMTFTPIPSLKKLASLLSTFFTAGFYVCAFVSVVSVLMGNKDSAFMFAGIALFCTMLSWGIEELQLRNMQRAKQK